MFVDPSTAFGAGLAIYDQRKRISKLLGKVRYLINHGRLKVAVFGPGGTGKTTLGLVLSGDFKPEKHPLLYKESIGKENYGLQGEIVGKVVVPPGQEFREHHWTDLYRELASGKSSGVINVVSWGYHAFEELSFKETTYYRDGMTQEEFMEAYLLNRRNRELDVIKKLVPRLNDAMKLAWMITLVSKQDLWWDRRLAVKEYYMQGEYEKWIQEVRESRGHLNFHHEYVSTSLVISNMVSGKGETLAETTAGYDQNIQSANTQKLLSTVYEYANL